MAEWISVETGKPMPLKDVLCHFSDGTITIDWFITTFGFVYESIYGPVTHWMPLPEPPKEGK